MAGHAISTALLTVVARRFRALAEPGRLLVLHRLEGGEQSVSALADATALSPGAVSRHLQVLHDNGFLARRRDGQFVYYRLADAQVLQLCELMCGRLAVELEGVREAMTA